MAATIAAAIAEMIRFSPLHEGDTSVAQFCADGWTGISSFSPLHEGDTSVANPCPPSIVYRFRVSVPFTRGTPLWLSPAMDSPWSQNGFSPLHEGDTSVAAAATSSAASCSGFQSPSRGGHLCGTLQGSYTHSKLVFQSPSRGGHLCGPGRLRHGGRNCPFQSPSRGGHLCGRGRRSPGKAAVSGFSPLHEGDTSVATPQALRCILRPAFQSPSRGGHLCGPCIARMTSPLVMFQSPSRGGHLCGPFCPPPRSPFSFQSPSRGGHLCGQV